MDVLGIADAIFGVSAGIWAAHDVRRALNIVNIQNAVLSRAFETLLERMSNDENALNIPQFGASSRKVPMSPLLAIVARRDDVRRMTPGAVI